MRVYNVTISINSTIRVVTNVKEKFPQILHSHFVDLEDDLRSCDVKKWVLQLDHQCVIQLPDHSF